MILVTGAAGFVGRHVTRLLVGRGERVRALVRGSEGAARLDDVDCELTQGDVTDPGSLRMALSGVDAVVHLVAIIAGRPADFDRVMTQGTANLLAAAREAGAGRIVYMSALGTSEQTRDTVPYYRSKWACEQAVTTSGIPYAILRPSFVFGPDGGALPRFLRIARLAPVTPVIGSGKQRIQPIWVDDLARAVAATLTGPPGNGMIELGGPDIVDWNELWSLLKDAQGARRPALHLPTWLMRPQALVLERLPGAPLTRDQLTMLSLGDNVVTDEGRSQESLGLGELVPLDEQLRLAVAATSG